MKSGNLCAFEACRRPLAIEVEQSGRTSIVSQEAHIVAEKPDLTKQLHKVIDGVCETVH